MQKTIRNQITTALNLVLAISIAMAPVTPSLAASLAAPSNSAGGSIGEQTQVFVRQVRTLFRAKTDDGKTVNAGSSFFLMEGQNEEQSAAKLLADIPGPKILITEEEDDQKLRDQVAAAVPAADLQLVTVNTPNKEHWKSAVKRHIGNTLTSTRTGLSTLRKDPSFKAIVYSFYGNAAGLGITLYFSNATLATGLALTGTVFASSIFSNMKVRGHEPYAILLNKGGEYVYRAAALMARAIGKSAAPSENILRRLGMLTAGIAWTALPTFVTLKVTGDSTLALSMLAATVRNAWDIPIDAYLNDLYERGRISYGVKKKFMAIKAFSGPIVDNASAANISVGGVPVARITAYLLAATGLTLLFASDRVASGIQTASGHARTIASKTKEVGVAIANSFGGARRAIVARVNRAKIERENAVRTALESHVAKCSDMLAGIQGYAELSPAWAGRRVADDIN